jgi:hypothetical protein
VLHCWGLQDRELTVRSSVAVVFTASPMSCRRQRCTMLSTLCYPGQTCSPEMGTVLEALLALWWLKHHLRGPLERSRAVCPASLPVGNANLVLATVPTCNSPKRKRKKRKEKPHCSVRHVAGLLSHVLGAQDVLSPALACIAFTEGGLSQTRQQGK